MLLYTNDFTAVFLPGALNSSCVVLSFESPVVVPSQVALQPPYHNVCHHWRTLFPFHLLRLRIHHSTCKGHEDVKQC